MRSTTLFSFGALSTAVALALPSPALAQPKGTDTKKAEPAPSAAPADTKSEWDAVTGEGEDAAPAEPKKDLSTVEPPKEQWDIYDVEEIPGRTYMFVGLRYRGNVVPAFMLNLFLDQGTTIYTNMIGAEFDLRKDGFSLIPALSYHELGTEDILFKQKDTPNIPGNYSVVNSGMKLLYASVDLLWSAKLSKNVEFEYGAGFGLGAVFGNLQNNWVQEDPNGPLVADTGRRYRRCDAVGLPGSGCNAADHQNSEDDKVGSYTEKSWFNGGSKPAIFPWISFPQIGLRIKPIKQFVGRIGVGFALTGFWCGFSGQYGLEKPRE